MKKLLISLAAVLALTGCATNQDYVVYGQIQTAYAQAEAARYKAIGDIGKSGDATAKVAAVMSLQGAGGGNARPQVAAPRTVGDTALQWASVLFPTVTQLYGINQNTQVSLRQSDNQAAIAQSTNATFLGMAGKIQAPAANMTIGGNGVLGSGSYAIGANSGTNSGNTGKLSGANLFDSTSTPTVVAQPEPIVVDQPILVPVPSATVAGPN